MTPITSAAPIRANVRRLRRHGRLTGILFLAPVVLFLVGALGYPIFVNVRFSFTSTTAGTLLSGGPWVGLANYTAVFTDPKFLESAGNTVVFTVMSIVFQLGLGLLLAAFYNQRFPGATRMSSLYLLAWAAPVVATGAVFRWLYDRQYGVINWLLGMLHLTDGHTAWLSDTQFALGAVTVANIWTGVPFYVTFFLAALKNIPEQVHEAASMDGAGAIRRFVSITVPMLRPPLLIGGVFGIIFTLKAFDMIWIMTRGGPLGSTETLSTYGYNQFFTFFQFGAGAAVMNVLLVVMIIVAAIYLRVSRGEES
ncbi:MAG: transporter permease [Microbacteriaceae bacterium]|nr:transporter permease [Microbacteriaceae bacterium]